MATCIFLVSRDIKFTYLIRYMIYFTSIFDIAPAYNQILVYKYPLNSSISSAEIQLISLIVQVPIGLMIP